MASTSTAPADGSLGVFGTATRTWFTETFGQPTEAQQKAWPSVAAGQSTLLVAPTGSGKTLAAFLASLDGLLFGPEPDQHSRCRVIYVSPIKALAFDIERNLRGPLAGISRTAARLGIAHRELEVAMRTGDTPPGERARFSRRGADLLITTPESLYLLLSSQARERLRGVTTVIVDEVHAVAGTKRGTHLLLTLERLQAGLPGGAPLQRIGLSATQRPLSEVARWLGGIDASASAPTPRPVAIADAHRKRPIELTIEVPIEDMGAMHETEQQLAPPAPPDPSAEDESGRDEVPALPDYQFASTTPRSAWTSIHPRLLELVRAHRSTMVFVNNRRLAERLAGAINELAEAPVARAHHGSVAREERLEIEDALKRGDLPCIVATSSLELGLDIGAIELVVQIEAPPSVSSGIQRIGRANHQVGNVPRGSLFPKHRGDLVACAEAARRMLEGQVEETRYPKNALDVLAQQAVAIVASGQANRVGDLLELVKRAAPYAELSREQLENVLDMLSGRYPSDAFSELRPRLTWDRQTGALEARKGALRLVVSNPGVIPDRGLYGVFLADAEGPGRRVGELDEEMVFEAQAGEVFVLGASSWRIEEITHDRVLVTPAPGQMGKLPFWRGDGLGRSAQLGKGIGDLLKTVESLPDAEAQQLLASERYCLEPRAADNLVRYVRDQCEAPYALPTDRRLVVETFRDEIGDYRVCILSALGRRVLGPLSLCLMEKSQRELGILTEAVWTDDGIVLRFPESDEPPDLAAIIPDPSEVDDLLMETLSSSPLFAAHFRECAGRALLLPRRTPTRRAPLWAQRKRAQQLLAVASEFPSFPIVLETYRECLQDVFDVPSLLGLLEEVASHRVRVAYVHADRPSPFSASLLFNYVGNFVYDQDAPLAERRAAALAIDTSQLRELMGQADFKGLLDEGVIEAVARQIGRLDHPPQDPDGLHDLLLFVGDLTHAELEDRLGAHKAACLAPLLRTRRAVEVAVAGQTRVIAAEDAARYRDAVGAMPPAGLPSAFLEPVARPLSDLVSRFTRVRTPFSFDELSQRYPAPEAELRGILMERIRDGRLLHGALHPQKAGDTYCDVDVMRAIKRRTLAKLRGEIEAVEPDAYARFLFDYHGLTSRVSVRDGLHGALERLQGLPLFLTELEDRMLPARLLDFAPADLDRLLSSGELLWRGIRPSGSEGGRVALYFRDDYTLLAPPIGEAQGAHVEAVRALLAERGAAFFGDIVVGTGGFGPDVLSALWELVWAGEVTNDSLIPLRSLARGGEAQKSRALRPSVPTRGRGPRGLGRRRSGADHPPGSEGRWSRLPQPSEDATARRAALVEALLHRHGVLVRDALKYEGVSGGFSAAYEVLRALEELGHVRRGYFVAGLGAAQFALPGVEERLRDKRGPVHGAFPHGASSATLAGGDVPETLWLAAADPACPFGATLPWPECRTGKPNRGAGAAVVVTMDGRLLAWLSKHLRNALTFFGPDPEADAAAVAAALSGRLGAGRQRALLLPAVDGADPSRSPLGSALEAVGFRRTSRGYLKRLSARPQGARDRLR